MFTFEKNLRTSFLELSASYEKDAISNPSLNKGWCIWYLRERMETYRNGWRPIIFVFVWFFFNSVIHFVLINFGNWATRMLLIMIMMIVWTHTSVSNFVLSAVLWNIYVDVKETRWSQFIVTLWLAKKV